MSKLKRILAMTLALTMMLVLVACGGSGDDANTEGRDDLVIAMAGEPPTLDPAKHTSIAASCVADCVFQRLIVHNYADDGIYPGIASEWTISEDGLTYDFICRDDFVFHDGTPVTMDDIVFSVKRHIESAWQSVFFETIESVEAVDETHLRLHLSKRDNNLLYYIGDYCSIVPKALVEADEESFARNPVGCGPYKFVGWSSGIEIKLEADPNYVYGEAAIKNVTYRFISDSSTAMVALETGDIDAYMTLSGADFEQARGIKGVTLDTCASNIANFLGVNADSGILQDKRVRQAISYAIDRAALIEGAEYGEAVICNNGFCMDGQMGARADRTAIVRDVEKAKALLADAGYADGFSVTLKCQSTKARHAEIIQADLKAVGIDVSIVQLENAAFFADLANGNTELFLVGSGQYTPDPSSNFKYTFRSDAFENGNYGHLANAEVDALITAGEEETDTAKRQEIYEKCVDLVEEEACMNTMYWSMASFAHDSDLMGTQATPIGVYLPYDYYWAE